MIKLIPIIITSLLSVETHEAPPAPPPSHQINCSVVQDTTQTEAGTLGRLYRNNVTRRFFSDAKEIVVTDEKKDAKKTK
ncbi:MAG: hypothetical protein ACPG5B_06720 [Chitinophagales bacterium]